MTGNFMDHVGERRGSGAKAPPSPEQVRTLGRPGQARQPLTPASNWAEGSHSGPRARGAGAKESQEIVSHWLFGGDATCLLGCSLEDDEIFLEVFIQF